jgi:hypothetical protein
MLSLTLLTALGLAPLPPQVAAGLSVADKCRIRDRATIMARHVYVDQGEAFADQQVSGRVLQYRINIITCLGGVQIWPGHCAAQQEYAGGGLR